MLGLQRIGAARRRDVSQHASPQDVSGLTSNVASVTTGILGHSCAVTTAGGAKCWGYNAYGQVGAGNGPQGKAEFPSPMDVTGLTSGVASISAGGAHTCALTTGGGVMCWGEDRVVLGDGGFRAGGPTPVDVRGLGGDVVRPSTPSRRHCRAR